MTLAPIWIAGRWQPEPAPEGSVRSYDPQTGEPIGPEFPVSGRATLETVLETGSAAARELAAAEPERIAKFLERCAERVEAHADALIASAHLETRLPREPRLKNVELPRTTGQLRQAARAARERSFCDIQIDTKSGIRSMRGPLGGPVAVFGPNNFPFAFNAVMGGDFAAALAAGNPVIAKAHPAQLGTTTLLARAASEALEGSGLPAASVQLIYALPSELGLELVSDRRVGATGFTGSRRAGLALKAAADRAGRPIYLEMSAINPVFVLPGALKERGSAIAAELSASCTLGAGQFCTKPGLSVLVAGPSADAFIAELGASLEKAPIGSLFGPGSAPGVAESVAVLCAHGARLLRGGARAGQPAFGFQSTLLSVSGREFLAHPDALQTEAFAAVHLVVLAESADELVAVAGALQGTLTAAIYSDAAGSDDALERRLSPVLRARAGRLLNDKMPTGVAVSPAMNHGGPFPATGHPGFTSVGLPASIARFCALHCYDQVRPARLPPELRDENPGKLWRNIDGEWSRGDVITKAAS